MNFNKILSILSVFVFCLVLLFVYSCAVSSEKLVEDSRVFMGTVIQIKVSIDPNRYSEAKAREVINKAYDEISRIENIYSVYKDTSEISRINRLRKNERLQITDGVFNLINRALYYSEITEGAFDITVKPLVDLWALAKKSGKLPDDEKIKNALNKVGYKNIVLDKTARTIYFKKDGMGIDLGGAAKGYATDMAIRIMKENGVDNALVTCGGDMYCLGKRSSHQLWKVGIQHPRDKNRLFLEIRLKNMAISTSGDYERYFIIGGKRYSHIIDPRTGYPIGDNIVSASVISPDSSTSDILATSMCIIGKKGFDVIKNIKDVDAILVQEIDNRLTVDMDEGVKERYGISKTSL